jgi:hypothetical protein
MQQRTAQQHEHSEDEAMPGPRSLTRGGRPSAISAAGTT